MTTIKRRTPPESPAPAVAGARLRYNRDEPQPFCTCSGFTDGWGFDPQMGLYVHASPDCWKPSRAMYAIALQSKTLRGVVHR